MDGAKTVKDIGRQQNNNEGYSLDVFVLQVGTYLFVHLGILNEKTNQNITVTQKKHSILFNKSLLAKSIRDSKVS